MLNLVLNLEVDIMHKVKTNNHLQHKPNEPLLIFDQLFKLAPEARDATLFRIPCTFNDLCQQISCFLIAIGQFLLYNKCFSIVISSHFCKVNSLQGGDQENGYALQNDPENKIEKHGRTTYTISIHQQRIYCSLHCRNSKHVHLVRVKDVHFVLTDIVIALRILFP
jgi:hypothetical protein